MVVRPVADSLHSYPAISPIMDTQKKCIRIMNTNVIDVKRKTPTTDGFYPTNVGFQYFEGGLWLTPVSDGPWEPTQNSDVTHWVDVRQQITPIFAQKDLP